MESLNHCPTCSCAVEYRRPLNEQMCRALGAMHSAHGRGWGHMPTTLKEAGVPRADEAKLRYWGLLEEEGDRRPDGGRAGWWRVTLYGELFLRGRLIVASHAVLGPGGALVELDETRMVSIDDCMGVGFDLREVRLSGT